MHTIDYPGLFALLGWVTLTAFFFAKVEIHIEGKDGWAASLPTWRIKHHWLLTLLWGGRPLTGYHAWVFPFMLFAVHFGFFITRVWSWNLELRALGAWALFWIIEDFFWFVCNPAFGLRAFNKNRVPWHPRWFCCLPLDYWYVGVGGLTMIIWTFVAHHGNV